MDSAIRFFRKYILSSIVLLAFFFVINVALIGGVLLAALNNSTDPEIPISHIAELITIDDGGKVSSDDEVKTILAKKRHGLWC
jgi:hypothetical protein